VVLVLSAIVDFANLGGYLSGASIPPVIVGIWVVLGVSALVAAGGLWAGRSWAATLAIALAAITVPLGAIGALTTDNTIGKAVATAGAILGLVVIALVTARARRVAA
jgi:uncharacterized membrane protein (DUF2068 family)